MQKLLCLVLIVALATSASAGYYGGFMSPLYGMGGLGYGLGGFGYGMGGLGFGGFGLGYGGLGMYSPLMFGGLGRMGFGKYGFY